MMTNIQRWFEANNIGGGGTSFLPNEVKFTEWFYGPKGNLHPAATAVEGREEGGEEGGVDER